MKLFSSIFMKFLRFAPMMAIALFLLPSCEKAKEGPPPAPPGVIVTPVIKADVVTSFQYIGQTVAVDNVDLVARVDGFLEERDFKEGQFVKKDHLLFVIEKKQYVAKVEAAKATLAEKQASAKKAELDYKRSDTLLKKKAMSQADYDSAVCAKASADAEVLAAQADLRTAELNLGYTDIKAPFDGKLGVAYYSVGDLVGTSSTKLANIVKLHPMKVEFNISEKDLVTALQERQMNKDNERMIPRIILANGTEYKQPGELVFWDNQVNPSTGTVKIKAEFPNAEHILIPGQYVKVVLSTKAKHEALLIPQSAVQENQAGEFVLIVDSAEKVQTRNVETGDKYGVNIEIKTGLKVGERVITQGLQKVKPGDPVKAVVDKAHMDADENTSAKKPAEKQPTKPEAAPKKSAPKKTPDKKGA